MRILVGVVVALAVAATCSASSLSITDFGAIASNQRAATNNSAAILRTFQAAQPGDVVVVPQNQTFYFFSVVVENKNNITFEIDGALISVANWTQWPDCDGSFCHVIQFVNSTQITVTSKSKTGVVDGQGYAWWWNEILQTLPKSRPKLFVFSDCASLLIEHVTFRNSPSWTLVLEDVADVVIRYVNVHTDVDAMKALMDKHNLRTHVSNLIHHKNDSWKKWLADLLVDLHIPTFPLNTDGMDLQGQNIHVHDCVIVNYDDSIVPKPSNMGHHRATCTQNILIENIEARGVGMSIGSVPPSDKHNCVNNVTMRNVTMMDTYKGIYVKTDPGDHGTGIISNIVFEDFKMVRPIWWAVWIGPQQQHQPGWGPEHQECSLEFPLKESCLTQPLVPIVNITLRNIEIQDPLLSPGVIRCNETRYDAPGPSCTGLVFDNVVVSGETTKEPYGDQYGCWNVDNSVAIEGTTPVPTCFNKNKRE